jgi:serine/threonine protein kinase
LPPRAAPKDAQELARELVKSHHLTKYQSQEIYQGRAKSLILGNYTILDRVGAGGMGQVFKAEHRRMKRTVAIKMLPAAMTKDVAALARFEREVVAAAKLSHPNIVAAYDADEAGGVHFLVMEYVDGSDLSALVKQNGPFPVDQAVGYILQAARGLEFAHSEGVIHRDIKPANLLVDKKGTIKILDMGLARIESSGNAATEAELTGTGAVMGTVDYIAPEQALSTKRADARADIYSLGCSLYYLLAGQATYGGESMMEKLLAHREAPIPSLRKVQPEVTEEIEAVFAKMVAKTVEGRYQTMNEVIADLERCRTHDQPVDRQINSISVDSGSLSFLRDAPASPTHKTTKHTVAMSPPPKLPGSPDHRRRKQRKLLPALGGIAVVMGGLLAGVLAFRGDEPSDAAKDDARSKPILEAWVTPREPLPAAGGQSSLVFRVGNAALAVQHRGAEGIKWSAGGPATSLPPSVESVDSVVVGVPAHVALTHDQDGVRFYLNGRPVGQPVKVAFSEASAAIEACRTDSKWHKVPFQGDLDEIRISTQVRYRDEFAPPPHLESDVQTVALYHCDEGHGDVLRDSSGSNRHGKIVGAKWVQVIP